MSDVDAWIEVMDRAIAEPDLAVGVEPGQRMFQPMDIVAVGIILARMSAAAFRPRQSGIDGHRRLRQEIVELQRLDQVAVPDQRAIVDLKIGQRIRDGIDLLGAGFERLGGAEHRAFFLHDLLHGQADIAGCAARAVAAAREVGSRRASLKRPATRNEARWRSCVLLSLLPLVLATKLPLPLTPLAK